MNKIIIIAIGFFSAMAFAGVSDVEGSSDRLSPATIEKIVTIRKESAKEIGIKLVQVDNGGSTDVSSVMVPSRLYLSFHQDGEMFDIEGSYLIVDGLIEVTEAKMLDDSSIRLKYTFKNDQLKLEHAQFTVLIGDVLKEAATASLADGIGTYVLKSTVGLKNANP